MFDQVMARVAGRFRRVEPRAAARAYLLGLLSSVERKNCWQLAEQAGHTRPGPMQRLLRSARWDADAVRDDLRAYAAEQLGADGSVLVVDETGFLKKSRSSAGVLRQYTGTAGPIENAQVGVFLALATSRGRALIDRRRYLPEHSWSNDPETPHRGRDTRDGAVRHQAPPGRADDRGRAGRQDHRLLGDRRRSLRPGPPAPRHLQGARHRLCPGRRLLDTGENQPWPHSRPRRYPRRPPARHGLAPSERRKRRERTALLRLGLDPHRHRQPPPPAHRRGPSTGELAFYLCWSPTEVPLSELVRVAGARWSVEECFQAAKSQVGLDHYQVRHWTSWHRHITLAMLALAFLTALAADATPKPPADTYHFVRSRDPITLTVPEIRHLLVAVFIPPPVTAARLLHWSTWRRRHQTTARRSHYRRRTAASEPAG